MGLQIIKFGGSVITDQDADFLFNRETVRRLARELPDRGRGCILIHGTGHVGKPPAARFGYLESGHIPPSSHLVALEIKMALRRLNQMFVETMLASSIAAIPFDTASFFNEEMNSIRDEQRLSWLRMIVDQGLTPVFYGDLVPLASGGFQVFSSDVIALILSRTLRPERMLFLSDVPGVYGAADQKGETIIKELSSGRSCRVNKVASDAQDVSGGMAKKIECAIEISRHCGDCFIGSGLEPGIAEGFLRGDKVPGTRVRG